MSFSANAAFAQLEEYQLSTTQLSELERGETVVVKLPPPKGKGVRFQAFQKMPVSSKDLRPIFIDCARFVEFMPRTKESIMTEKKTSSSQCEMVVEMPFPFDDLWSVVRAQWGVLRPGVWQRRWTLIRGSFHRNQGSWTIHDGPSPNTSYAVYAASVDPQIPIPDFILRAAQVNTIPDLMQAIIKRAQHLSAADVRP